MAPRALAPNLYKQGRHKFRTVHKELTGHKWISNLRDLDSQMLLDEFSLLYTALSTVTPTMECDRVHWRWTPSGEYTAALAYDAQFLRATTTSTAMRIWKAKSEPKCKFFAWLAIHGKVQTTDNLLRKNYPCNLTCPLCYCIPETTNHLLVECNFTEAAWEELVTLLQLPYHARATVNGDVSSCIVSITSSGTKRTKQQLLGILVSFC